MTDLSKKLSSHTRLSPERRGKALRWIVKQNEELILVAFEKQKENYFKLSKIDEENKSVLYLAALYTAVEELYTLLQTQKKKNRTQTLDSVGDITKLQAKQFRHMQAYAKWNKLLNIKNKIIKLIEEENLSFRGVSKYLKKYHRFDVSHAYIATFYDQIKGK